MGLVLIVLWVKINKLYGEETMKGSAKKLILVKGYYIV
jgi:hypothetical protein